MQILQRIIGGLVLTFIASGTLSGSVYQAETASLYKAVLEIKNSGYIGDSYINFDNEIGSYLELRVGILNSGSQEVKIRFANGGTSARPMDLSLNNTVVSSLVFESTGDWTVWETFTISLELQAGINLIRLTSTGSEGGPNVDQFEISGTQLPYYTLELSVNGAGNITRDPADGLLFKGQQIRLIANSSVGSEFKEWQGDKTGTSDTLEFIMDADKTISAVFEDLDLDIPYPDFSMIGYATLSGEGVSTTTGGLGGDTIIIETLQELSNWGLSREDNYTMEFIIIKGYIEAVETEVITIKRGANITILGDPESEEKFAELKNISLNIRDYSNVIVRNLKMHEVWYPNDDLTIDHCHHVWVDHCEFHSVIGTGIGVDTYDGLLDIKKGSHNVTVSWCYFHDHMKTLLMGHSDNNGDQDVDLQATLHHNWFSNTDGRNPSLRFGHIHYFNNFLENISDYGLAVRNGAHAKIENCHFESVKTPVATDKFEGHGNACISGSVFSGTCTSSDMQITEPLDCDFWTDNLPYVYELEDVNTVALSVQKYAGVGQLELLPDTVTLTDSVVKLLPRNMIHIEHAYFSKADQNLHISLQLTNQKELWLTIYSMTGAVLFFNKASYEGGPHQLSIQLNKLTPGVYILDLRSRDMRQGRKFVIQ